MNKQKTAIVIIAIILIITAVVLVNIFKSRNEAPETATVAPNASAPAVKSPAAEAPEAAVQVQTDSDVNAINSDLDSISDDDFGDSSLSDQNVGL